MKALMNTLMKAFLRRPKSRRTPRLAFAIVALHAAACPAVSGETVWDEADSWAFVPPAENFTEEALLDLRWMNEAQSGQSGFIRRSESGDSFVKGDGEPIRFWAVGSDVHRASPAEMDRHCRFLAKLGVNLARLHVTIAATQEGASITDVDRKAVDGVFRFIRAAKDNGIYVIISPYYAHHETPKSWGLTGYSETGGLPWGAIFIDQRMQEAYKEWTRVLYATKNPHTGLAIKDDPTVAILQVHNEDSLFFWTVQGLPPAMQQSLQMRYHRWLADRFGGVAQALRAWSDAPLPGDDPDAGRVALYDIYQMTQDQQGGHARRMRAQVEFMAGLQRDFYAGMGAYLREELGCGQLLNATNWRTANDQKLKAVERWTYAALDIDAENEYYGADYQHVGENDLYRIDPGHHFVNESCLHKPLELTTNFVCGVGRPFVVTETSWKRPNLYQSEGPFLTSAFQSSGGVDAVCWFSATDSLWQLDPRRLFWPVRGSYALEKWTCSTPMLMGMFPAAAITFRCGHLKESPVVAHETWSRSAVLDREPMQLDDGELYGVSRETDELKSATRSDGRPSRAAFLIGRVTTEFDLSESAAHKVEYPLIDVASHLAPERGLVTNATREIAWDYQRGVCTVDSPKTQGVTGFLRSAGGAFPLSSVEVRSDNHYATVTVVSLDDQPLSSSGRILVQIGTAERLTDWSDAEAEFNFKGESIRGSVIENAGKPPIRIANAHTWLSIDNPSLSESIVLDAAGYARERGRLQAVDDRISFELPADALYVILRR